MQYIHTATFVNGVEQQHGKGKTPLKEKGETDSMVGTVSQGFMAHIAVCRLILEPGQFGKPGRRTQQASWCQQSEEAKTRDCGRSQLTRKQRKRVRVDSRCDESDPAKVWKGSRVLKEVSERGFNVA